MPMEIDSLKEGHDVSLIIDTKHIRIVMNNDGLNDSERTKG
jgi:hypothetical protein